MANGLLGNVYDWVRGFGLVVGCGSGDGVILFPGAGFPSLDCWVESVFRIGGLDFRLSSMSYVKALDSEPPLSR